ncbi:MAG: S8 family serine peptidase [Prevotella sp.]|nr:S8 family serine peptidase [Prevotella sp.]
MIRVFTVLLALTLASTAYAATKIKYPGGKQYMYRLKLADKSESPYRVDHPTRWLSAKSIERRRRQGLLIDSTDLPVSPTYLKVIQSQTGVRIVAKSRWNNTVVIHTADSAVAKRLQQLPFVKTCRLVWISPDSIDKRSIKWNYHEQFNAWDSIPGEHYGGGKEQIESLGGQRLHNIGMRGRGMTIAILDGGFRNVNRIPSLQSIRTEGIRDFIWHNPQTAAFDKGDEQIYDETDHGTRVLSAMAANISQVLVGTAPEARYWLLRCEDQQTEQPVEEDYWAMAAEFADSAGVDIINSSLGYNDYDPPHPCIHLNELDGETSLISHTASMLAAKGIILVNSAGNTGMSPWKKICVPADAHHALTVGALSPQGRNASFSAVGPTQDGRVKPDVMAIGSPATLISGRGNIVHDMGTSFSTPIVCGLVACLWQSLPGKSALDIIDLVRRTADNHNTPNNIYGYGKPNFWKAYMIGRIDEERGTRNDD